MWNVARYSILAFFSAYSAVLSTGCISVADVTGSSSTSTSTSTSTTSTTTSSSTTSSSSSSASVFAGASGAVNIDGANIKISWATFAGAASYAIYLIQSDGSLGLIANVASTTTSYTQTGLTNGLNYSYVVRECDIDWNCDTNSNIVTALAFAGVTGYSNLGNVEATLNFNPGTSPSASAYNVYCARSGGSYILFGSGGSTATSVSVTGLSTYTAYKCRVNAVSSSGVLDSNTATVSFTTRGYLGMQLATAYGSAPNAPSPQPTSAQVSLTWLKFQDDSANPLYKVVRVLKGTTTNMSTTTYCSSATQSPCFVCMKTKASTGSTNFTCSDPTVAYPNAYDYEVASAPTGTLLNSSAWLLPASDTAYRVTVQIPPANMVLVQRDSVNYEMCLMLGTASDPLNYQRCAYSGLGAVPYNTSPGNTPLSLPPNYYDMGYNFFVDRWDVGCPWSLGTGTGKCSAGSHTVAANCFGAGAPAATTGAAGNIYYDTTGGGCYLNYGAASWSITNSMATSANLLSASTNAPGVASTWDIPPLTNVTQQVAWNTCQATSDTTYGLKRLLRRREFIAAAAWNLSNEPGAADFTISTMIAGNSLPTLHACNTSSGNGITTGAFNTTDLANATGTGPAAVILGSGSTSSCLSRFGAQDLIGNVDAFTSEQIGNCTGGSSWSCAAGTSLDSGDLDLNNLVWDGVTGGPGGVSLGTWLFNTAPAYASKFVPTLGLPLAGTSSPSLGGMTIGSGSGQFNPSGFLSSEVIFSNATSATPIASSVGGNFQGGVNDGRFSWILSHPISYSAYVNGFRCALPAQ